jgi:outer membrane protein OmpA-like peptidoglycan-associated protein
MIQKTRFLISIIFLLLSVSAVAQKYTSTVPKAVKAFENARAAFDQRNSDLALSFLEDAIARDPKFVEAYLMQFEVYSEAGKLDDARESLIKAVEVSPDFFPAAWFFLGALEASTGKYAEALPRLQKYLSYRTGDPEMRERAQQLADNCNFAIKAVENPVNFTPVNIGEGVNTPMPEYYPAITADGQSLLFTRLVADPAAYKGKNEEFYVSQKIGDVWGPARPIREINSAYNEGAPTLTADGRTLIFTACELFGDYGTGRTGFGSCDLFISRKEGNRWSDVQNMGPPINTRNWETQPSLSADGRTLYFIRGKSTREGVQNQDILVSNLQPDGTWSTPLSVSPKINTPGREESVMIHPDGQTIYFASDGHIGMGGLDLYMSSRDDQGYWQEPVNLGYPINTFKDENSLLVGPDGAVAFFASNRAGGLGELDLYSFEMPVHARPTPVTYARGLVTDAKTGLPLLASLSLYDVNKEGEGLAFETDPQTGTFLIALPTGNTYALSVNSDGYLFHSETFVLTSADLNKPYQLHIKLQKPEQGSSIVLKNIFFDTDKDLLKSQSTAELKVLSEFMKQNPTLHIEISGHTDNQGSDSYNVGLSQRRAAAVKGYLTDTEGVDGGRITTKGYGATKPVASNDTDEGRAANRRTEFMVTGVK